MRDYYVYAYFRPDGSPCYIGKGRGSRWLIHERPGACSNPGLAALIALHRELPKVKLQVCLTSDQARDIEAAFIRAIGRDPDGPLVNLTDGKEGRRGFEMGEDVRRKISAALTGKNKSPSHRANLSASRKALFAKRRAEGAPVKLSAEHRAAIGAGNVGKRMSPEARAKMSAAKKGKPIPHRDRMTTRGKPKSPEHRAKLAAHLTALNKSRAKSRLSAATDF